MRWLAVPLLGLGLVAGLAYGPATAGVVNSKHDFSRSGTGGIWGSSTEDEVCIFCHTPHGAQAGLEPLWNRVDPGHTFAVYTSSTLNATPGQPSGPSRLCLSCHDGSVAIDAYVQGGATPTMMALGDVYYPGSPYGQGGANIGGNYSGNAGVNDLMNDHPVSFSYDAALVTADGHLNDPTTVGMPLYQGKLECSTCHDVHNQAVVAGSKLLRVTQTGSQICLRCHAK
jgi:predicted CXXCH cytochrome family protein